VIDSTNEKTYRGKSKKKLEMVVVVVAKVRGKEMEGERINARRHDQTIN
jgi:hypothetical protein